MNFLWPQHDTLEERNATGELACFQGVIQHCERENIVVVYITTGSVYVRIFLVCGNEILTRRVGCE